MEALVIQASSHLNHCNNNNNEISYLYTAYPNLLYNKEHVNFRISYHEQRNNNIHENVHYSVICSSEIALLAIITTTIITLIIIIINIIIIIIKLLNNI